jgi:hypothetical protein
LLFLDRTDCSTIKDKSSENAPSCISVFTTVFQISSQHIYSYQPTMQPIAHIQLLIFLFFLPFGQTIAFDKKNSARTSISCCVFGFDFESAADTCQYWGANCEGGWPACATTAVEQSLCSQCLTDPTREYCAVPITQNKRDLGSGDTSLAKNIM